MFNCAKPKVIWYVMDSIICPTNSKNLIAVHILKGPHKYLNFYKKEVKKLRFCMDTHLSWIWRLKFLLCAQNEPNFIDFLFIFVFDLKPPEKIQRASIDLFKLCAKF
jgi:hypothetical protein